jgi:hypothetical protein
VAIRRGFQSFTWHLRPQDRQSGRRVARLSACAATTVLLNARQQPLRFGQSQTQVGDIAKTFRPAELCHVEASGLTVDAGSNQPQIPPHPRTPSRRLSRPIVTLSSSSS